MTFLERKVKLANEATGKLHLNDGYTVLNVIIRDLFLACVGMK